MGLETGTYIDDLNSSNPVAGDDVNQGDDHIRLLKSTILASFPNITGAMTKTHTELNDGFKIAGDVVQVVHVQDGTVATGTTTLPLDDTTPQNTEGDEYMTLAITPTDALNKLKIEAVVHLSHSAGSGAYMAAALFQDSTADALAVAWGARAPAVAGQSQVVLTHYMTAGAASSMTFKIRAGTGVAGTTTFNGALGTQYFNGLFASTITISEIAV